MLSDRGAARRDSLAFQYVRDPDAVHDQPGPRGRGAVDNPANRYERLHVEMDDVAARVPTQFLRDASRTVIARNDSPDIGFDRSVNPYRGCEHGCAYCYARPSHEYLGWSAGLDFETRILVKESAPELLRRELSAPSWEPRVVALSGVTDPYQPVERRLRLTRGCLEVLADFCNPVAIVTKNELVTRDVDVLRGLARHRAAGVALSITTLDPELAGALEPRTSAPARRLRALERLSAAGIPCRVMVAPVIPGLNEHEIPDILAAAADAGATSASWILLRLPGAVAPLFEAWIHRHRPESARKVLGRIRETREGRLNSAQFGERMRGKGSWARQIADLFEAARRRSGLASESPPLSIEAFRRPGQQRLPL